MTIDVLELQELRERAEACCEEDTGGLAPVMLIDARTVLALLDERDERIGEPA